MGPKWVQNGSKMGPKWVQNGSKMSPKWVKMGKESVPIVGQLWANGRAAGLAGPQLGEAAGLLGSCWAAGPGPGNELRGSAGEGWKVLSRAPQRCRCRPASRKGQMAPWAPFSIISYLFVRPNFSTSFWSFIHHLILTCCSESSDCSGGKHPAPRLVGMQNSF